MKAYVATTSTVFSLLTLSHVWRVVVEPQMLSSPWYWLITIAAACFAIWGWRLFLKGQPAKAL
jgi:hypothetical protein